MISEPYDTYRARPRMSSHELQMFARCPRHYKRYKDGLIKGPEDSAAFALGRAAHTLILEGRVAFGIAYMDDSDSPINPKTEKPYGKETIKYKAWAAKQCREIVTDSTLLKCEEMLASVNDHPVASELFKVGLPEQVIIGEINGVSCKIRTDWLAPKAFIDLKTTRNIDTFIDDFWAFGYDYQLGFYSKMLSLEGFPIEKVYIVAVEKSQPFRTAVYEIGPQVLKEAGIKVVCDLTKLENFKRQNMWPTNTEDIISIDILDRPK